MIFDDSLPEFKKDFKNLKKRFRSLDDDFENFKEYQVITFHKEKINNSGIVCISKTGSTYPKLYKAKKFACKSLKGSASNSGIRVIYAYLEREYKIVFIEIYFKGDKENEDKQRIFDYLTKFELANK